MSNCEYGRIQLTVDGERISARGAFDIKPTNFEREVGSNLDQTIWSSAKPMPAEAVGSIDACSVEDFNALMDACDLTVTFSLGNPSDPDVWIFPQAVLAGRPSLNTEAGEVSDIMFKSAFAVRG